MIPGIGGQGEEDILRIKHLEIQITLNEVILVEYNILEGLSLMRYVSCLAVYKTIGCYKDMSNRAIQTLEGTDSVLDGSYGSRKNPIAKCAVAAMRKGYTFFAVQAGGWCASSSTAALTFDKYGKSTACAFDGEGGGWANQVYFIKC